MTSTRPISQLAGDEMFGVGGWVFQETVSFGVSFIFRSSQKEVASHWLGARKGNNSLI